MRRREAYLEERRLPAAAGNRRGAWAPSDLAERE